MTIETIFQGHMTCKLNMEDKILDNIKCFCMID